MLTMKTDEPKGYLPEDIFSLMNVLAIVEEDCTTMEESVVNYGKKKIILKYHSLKKKNPTLRWRLY